LLVGSVALLLVSSCSTAKPARYTFSWPIDASGERLPRGGTSKGPAPSLDPDPSPGWQALQEAGLSAFERDRRAILAMAGPYRVSFDFLETYALTEDPAELDVPYQSWATEYVYVVEDRGDFISLQHVMVMFFEGGEFEGPLVTKHWRQDWTFQDRDLHVYRGHGRWERKRPSEAEARGAWSQAVFQVDDSPRYEALGRWQHDGNLSFWQSETTWRPLPRREFSVRSDYQALVGTNRHVITPTGWIHEQENAKRRVPAPGGGVDTEPRYLSKEIGLNRYLRIRDHDFSAGDSYWEKTSPYWREVRAAWREIYASHETLELAARHEDTPLFVRHFVAAEQSAESGASQAEIAAEVRATLADYVSAPAP
jgi:hypothetical protein